jgi:hypothetical protein
VPPGRARRRDAASSAVPDNPDDREALRPCLAPPIAPGSTNVIL